MFSRYFLPALAVCGLAATAAFGSDDIERISERDAQAVKQFVYGKRAMMLSEKSDSLALSADVRFEWQALSEKHNGLKHRGGGSGPQTNGVAAYGSHEFDVEVNIYMDYTAERSWAKIQLQLDNMAGGATGCANQTSSTLNVQESGTSDKLSLKQAYMGYNILEEGTSRLDVEIGRRNFYHVFESRVQFLNRFDGILLRYSNAFEGVADFYVNGGLFVIDSVTDNYGWVVELGFNDILDFGLDLKYSFIDWTHDGADRNGGSAPTGYGARKYEQRNSQISGAYHLDPEMINTHVKVYGGFLMNHAARSRTETGDKKERLAWYLGVMFGEIQGEGDWAVDINYQNVEAQAIGDHDVSGIGRGNAIGVCFPASTNNDGGMANYKGFQVEGQYALTDHITLNLELDYAKAESSSIGDSLKYRKLEVEVMYAW